MFFKMLITNPIIEYVFDIVAKNKYLILVLNKFFFNNLIRIVFM